MNDHLTPQPDSAPYVSDKRCVPLLSALLIGKPNTAIETRAIAVSFGSQAHLPKMGSAILEVSMIRGAIASATVDFRQLCLPIQSFSLGLDGSCLAARIRTEWSANDVKVFFDIPAPGENEGTHPAKLLDSLFRHAGEPDYAVEPIHAWFERLRESQDRLSR